MFQRPSNLWNRMCVPQAGSMQPKKKPIRSVFPLHPQKNSRWHQVATKTSLSPRISKTFSTSSHGHPMSPMASDGHGTWWVTSPATSLRNHSSSEPCDTCDLVAKSGCAKSPRVDLEMLRPGRYMGRYMGRYFMKFLFFSIESVQV